MTTLLQTRVPRELAARFKSAAQAEGKSTYQALRDLAEQYADKAPRRPFESDAYPDRFSLPTPARFKAELRAESSDGMKNIIDTGPLAYRFDRADSPAARWSRKLFAEHSPPFFTCEAVLAEAAHMTNPELIARMVKDGDLVADFCLQEEIESVYRLLAHYPNMDLADACLVRMSELSPDCRIFTIDRDDFTIYRRFRNKPVPAVFPED